MQVEIDNFREKVGALFWSRNVLEYVADNTNECVKGWYASLPEDWFDNPAPFPDGTPRHGGKRTFMAPLSTNWKYVLLENGFDLNFSKPQKDGSMAHGLRLQQYGGEIRPKRKRALTIPVTADARGISARTFEVQFGRRLFVVKGEAAKRDPDMVGSLVWEDPSGDLHAAYVLRKRSNVPSLRERRGHDALPSREQLLEWAAEKYVEALNNPYINA